MILLHNLLLRLYKNDTKILKTQLNPSTQKVITTPTYLRRSFNPYISEHTSPTFKQFEESGIQIAYPIFNGDKDNIEVVASCEV